MASIKSRIAWPDWVKGIGILSVVMAHVIQYFPEIDIYFNKIIRSYALPIFFLWAGTTAVLWPEKYRVSARTFYYKRIKRYLVPYVFFSLLNSALKLGVLSIIHALTKPILMEELKALLITGNSTVWFLRTIFMVEIIFYELRRCPFLRYVVLIPSLFLPFLFSSYTAIPAVLLLSRTALAYFYFMVGYILWSWFARCWQGNTPAGAFFIGLTMIISGCIISHFYPYQIEFFSGSFLNGRIAIPVSILISGGIILICYSIRDRQNTLLRIVQYFGRESMLIMLLHPTILLFFTYPFGNWFHSISGSAAVTTAVLLFLLVMLLTIPFISVINRWFPILKGESRQ